MRPFRFLPTRYTDPSEPAMPTLPDPSGLASSVLRADIQALKAYHVPDASGFVKLDAMENPYRLPGALTAELARRLADAAINLYPDPTASGLKTRLRRAFGIDDRWSLIIGNGSDELIQLVVQAVAKDGATVMGVDPSFVMYRMIAQYTRLDYVGVSLKPDFSLDMEATLAAIRQHQPAVLFLTYPNNPTGNLFPRDQLEALIEATPGLVVMDEAYLPFARETFADALDRLPNLVIMRTVSKLGLAGLRLGYLFGAPAWVDVLDKLRMPYNVGVLNQTAASFVLDHLDVLEAQTDQILRDRAQLVEALKAYPQFTVFPSAANFVLVRMNDAAALHRHLLDRKIMVKPLFGGHPLLENCLRITVGSPDENRQLLAAIRDFYR